MTHGPPNLPFLLRPRWQRLCFAACGVLAVAVLACAVVYANGWSEHVAREVALSKRSKTLADRVQKTAHLRGLGGAAGTARLGRPVEATQPEDLLPLLLRQLAHARLQAPTWKSASIGARDASKVSVVTLGGQGDVRQVLDLLAVLAQRFWVHQFKMTRPSVETARKGGFVPAGRLSAWKLRVDVARSRGGPQAESSQRLQVSSVGAKALGAKALGAKALGAKALGAKALGAKAFGAVPSPLLAAAVPAVAEATKVAKVADPVGPAKAAVQTGLPVPLNQLFWAGSVESRERTVAIVRAAGRLYRVAVGDRIGLIGALVVAIKPTAVMGLHGPLLIRMSNAQPGIEGRPTGHTGQSHKRGAP